jgi:hypothetical protein
MYVWILSSFVSVLGDGPRQVRVDWCLFRVLVTTVCGGHCH